MTVKIAQMTANFANVDIVYTAIGMTVNDAASQANSKLLDCPDLKDTTIGFVCPALL